MTAEKTNLQKLEALLHSATNERQRKMYLALLSKAQASSASSSSTSTKQKITQSPTKPNEPSPSRQKKSASINNSAKKTIASTNPVVQATSVNGKATSTKKTTDKKKKTSTTSNQTKVAKVNQIEQDQKKAETKVKTKAKKQSKETTRENNDLNKAKTVKQREDKNDSVSTSPAAIKSEKTIFKGVGIVKGTPYLEDDKLFVRIDGRQYDLRKVVGDWNKPISLLRSELDKNGSREMLLKVYPNITHYPEDRPPHHVFRLVRAYLESEKYHRYSPGFNLCGIWRLVSHCKTPVITIYRNIERLETFQKLPRIVKKPYAKGQDLPVIWEYAPVKPFIYHPEKLDSEQMPCYFVQVRAAFKDGLYIVEEMLEEPTLDIPPYIQRPPKNRQPRPNSTKPASKSNEALVS